MNPAPVTSENESAVPPYGAGWTRWIRPIALSFLLILFDELGVFAFFTGCFLILVYLPRSLLARKYAAFRKERLIRLAIYLAAVAVVFSLIQINKHLSKDRAEKIIGAVENYKTANGKYPDHLNQLVPEFIAEIPAKARITFTDNGFRYLTGESHTLMYVAMPPFGRVTYNFETKSWGFID